MAKSQLNEFDAMMERRKRLPSSILQAHADVNDTLEFMWASARATFGASAQPEHAIAMLPIALARIDAQRQQELVEWRERMDGGSTAEAPARKPAKDR